MDLRDVGWGEPGVGGAVKVFFGSTAPDGHVTLPIILLRPRRDRVCLVRHMRT